MGERPRGDPSAGEDTRVAAQHRRAERADAVLPARRDGSRAHPAELLDRCASRSTASSIRSLGTRASGSAGEARVVASVDRGGVSVVNLMVRRGLAGGRRATSELTADRVPVSPLDHRDRCCSPGAPRVDDLPLPAGQRAPPVRAPAQHPLRIGAHRPLRDRTRHRLATTATKGTHVRPPDRHHRSRPRRRRHRLEPRAPRPGRRRFSSAARPRMRSAARTARPGSSATPTPTRSTRNSCARRDAAGTKWRAGAAQRLISNAGALDYGALRDPAGLAAVLAEQGIAHELLSVREATGRWPGFAFDGPVLWHEDAGVIDAESAVTAMVDLAVRGRRATAQRLGGIARGARRRRVHRGVGIRRHGRRIAGRRRRGRLAPRAARPARASRATRSTGSLRSRCGRSRRCTSPIATRRSDWPTFIHKRRRHPGLRPAGRPRRRLPRSEGRRVQRRAGDRLCRSSTIASSIPRAATGSSTTSPANLPGLVPEPYAETTCLFTNAPDDEFIIDRVEGITILSPCSGHGAKFAPLLGELAARLVTDEDSGVGPIPPPRGIGRRMTGVARMLDEISSIGRDRTRGGFSRAGLLERRSRAARMVHRPRRAARAGCRTRPQRHPLGVVEPRRRRRSAPSSPAATSTRFPAAAATTGRWASHPLSRRSTSCARTASNAAASDRDRGLPRGGGLPVRGRVPRLAPDERGDQPRTRARADRPRRRHVRRRRPPRRARSRVDGNGCRDARRASVHSSSCTSSRGAGSSISGQPVAIGSSILGHGRWRVTVDGQGNHAGTTLMADRRDPLVAAARMVVEIRDLARRTRGCARDRRADLEPVPGGTNVIASQVRFWIDIRHPEDAVTASLVVAGRATSSRARPGGRMRRRRAGGVAEPDRRLRPRPARCAAPSPAERAGAGHRGRARRRRPRLVGAHRDALRPQSRRASPTRRRSSSRTPMPRSAPAALAAVLGSSRRPVDRGRPLRNL